MCDLVVISISRYTLLQSCFLEKTKHKSIAGFPFPWNFLGNVDCAVLYLPLSATRQGNQTQNARHEILFRLKCYLASHADDTSQWSSWVLANGVQPLERKRSACAWMMYLKRIWVKRLQMLPLIAGAVAAAYSRLLELSACSACRLFSRSCAANKVGEMRLQFMCVSTI